MSSGNKEIVMNPLERAVSTDINRAQNFQGAMLSELFRALISTSAGTDDVQAGAQWNQRTSQGNPAWAQVISGFLFAPTGGTTGSSISAGTAFFYDPDATPSADDSQYKLIEDPGTNSTLTTSIGLTANSSGSLRIDVLECARVQPDSILESDSRDVFNTVTGLFSAATVNKVSQAQLQYRIRLGTAGSGFPGTAQGWMPICVMSVPTGTSLWDTVTIWDVRPLMVERLFSLTDATRDLPAVTRCMAQIDSSGFTSSFLTGVIEAQLGNRRVGGSLRPSTPQTFGTGADSENIALEDPQNQSASGSISTAGLNYVYICTPFGLPGWRKYTLGPNGRTPRSPRGIIFNSSTPPNLAYGTPSVALSLPPCLQATGNTATDLNAVCVLTRIGTHSGVRGVSSLVASGGIHMSLPTTAPNTGSISGTTVTFTLVAGTDFPPHARAIYVQLTTQISWGSTVTFVSVDAGTVSIAPTTSSLDAITTVQTPRFQVYAPQVTGTTYAAAVITAFTTSVRLPLPSQYQLQGVPGTTPPGATVSIYAIWALNIALSSGTAALLNPTLNVQGWELLDAD
jgi:hypothetical protein